MVGVIPLGFRGNDLIEKLALAVLLARLHVGLCHGDGFAEGAAVLGRDHDHARTRWRFEDELPLLSREISFRGHRSSPISAAGSSPMFPTPQSLVTGTR